LKNINRKKENKEGAVIYFKMMEIYTINDIYKIDFLDIINGSSNYME
jgi:hypothetical protein